jgi:hypothetical protein
MVKCVYISSRHYVFHYYYCLVYSMLTFININLSNCSCNCIVVVVSVFSLYSLLCSVSFVVYVVLCAVFSLSVVCYFV